MDKVFETERLYVRRYTMDDAEHFFQLNGDPDVVRYIRPPKSREESHKFLLQNIDMYRQLPFMGRWAMLYKPTGVIVGSFAVFPIDNTKDIQLGYSLLKEHWGRGFASESIPAGRRYAFDHLCLKEIFAITEQPNTASQHALLKNGFVRIGEKMEGDRTLLRFSSANPDHIETARLRIFPLSEQLLHIYLQADDQFETLLGLARFGRVVSPNVREMVERLTLPQIRLATTEQKIFHTFWLAVEKDTGTVLAELGFKGVPDGKGQVEIGYGTMPVHEGKGFMTEAVGGIISWAQTRPDIKSIIAESDKANIASIRILEKNNFTHYTTKGNMLWWKKTL